MEDVQQLDPHESESRLTVTAEPDRPNPVAAVFLSDPFCNLDVESESDGSNSVAADLSIADGLHLKPERCPREDYAVAPLLNGEAIFRHSGWKLQRQQTWDALQRIDPLSMSNYRFANCGSGAWLQQSADGQSCRCVCNCCHHKLCVPCQRAVGRTVQENIRQHLAKRPARFVTLTLRHNRTKLSDQISRLFDCWSRLRRRTDVKDIFEGGVAVLEVKVSDRDALWHVHLHIITEGCFIEQRVLSQAWLAITGDSSIVDVRRVTDQGKGVAYLCKYISKPIDASLYASPRHLDEFVTAIHGRKTVATFGTWRGVKLKLRPKDDTVWRNVCSLIELAARCKRRDVEALRLLAILRHEEQQPSASTPPPVDDTA